jgi:PKD repeat protein
MMAKPIIAILAVALLLSSLGTVGSFYFVSSQGQTTTEPPELTLSETEASPGSVIEVEGINFGANSQVSIYFMSAEEADLTDGSAFVLQGIDANQSTTTEPEGTNTFFDADGDALHTLGDLLELSTDQGGNDTTGTTTSISEHNLLVVLEEGAPVNGTMSLECEDVNIAQGRINGTVGTFGVSPGTYNECSISISDADITDTGEIEELVVVSDSEEDYENSLVISETANEEGTFESSVTVPNVEEGEYAILAVADDRRTAVSALSVTVAETVTEPAANATEGIMNETIIPAPEEEELAEEESTELLTVGIISNGTESVVPATFEFQANLTGGTEPYTYIWNFGDGSEESDEQTVLHTFEEAGTYNVTLAATDTDNQNAFDSIEITVNEPPPPTTITEPLTVGIISNGTESVVPATFEFQANLTGGTGPYTISWDFGDGSEESDEQTVLHTFEEAGTYNVVVTGTDENGQEASDNLEITVNEPPPPPPPTTITEPLTVGIISNGTESVVPATFEFQANLTGGTEPYTYIWNFGDGSEESDEQTVLHTFEEAGTYNVTLAATDTDNQNAFDSIEISVEELAEEGGGEAATTTVQNQTQNNQTDIGEEEPTVQLDETSAEPGSPLAISGEGFQSDTPIQIFINNVQITNVITNVEGSFNTVVIVPTTVAAGSAQVVIRTEQTNIIQNVNIIQLDGRTEGPSTLSLTAVSATDNGEALRNAPVTVFDAISGEVIETGRTPMDIELQEGTYSIFYSDFGRFEFESAEPGRWIDTPDGGSGLITIREGRNTTVTAIYSEQPVPPPPPRVTDNSLTLRAQDTQGNLIEDMFVTIYDAEAAEKIEQGFTEIRVDDLPPGTYPIFFSNFEDLEFLSASPGTWIQTPFGGVGLVTITDDGEDHNIVVTAEYNRTTIVEEQFNIQAPLDLEGNIFTITSNETRPEGPFVMSGTFALRVSDEEPVSATLSAYFMSAREDSNENVDLESQRSRDHDTFQIMDLKPRVARPIGLNSYVVSGTADLLLNGDMYSNDERVHVIVRGGEELTPTNIEIDFRGDQRYSAANRLDTLYGAVSSGFQ